MQISVQVTHLFVVHNAATSTPPITLFETPSVFKRISWDLNGNEILRKSYAAEKVDFEIGFECGLLAIASDTKIELIDLNSLETKISFECQSHPSVINITADGKRLFLCGRKSVEVWDIASSKPVKIRQWDDEHQIRGVLPLTNSRVVIQNNRFTNIYRIPAALNAPVKRIHHYREHSATNSKATLVEAFDCLITVDKNGFVAVRELSDLDQLRCLIRLKGCLLYTSPSPRDQRGSRMPSSA